MEKLEMLYEGKAKKIFKTDKKEKLIVEYKDDATAFNGEKKGQIKNKGELNTEISTIFFELLEENDVPTHLIEKLNKTELLVKKLKIIPIEVVMRNIAAGSLAKRLGLEEGKKMKMPILEYYYKDDELGDPMINEYHIFAEEMASKEELEKIKEYAFKINEILYTFLKTKGIDLVDFKLEFGLDLDGNVILGDEISPDTCRFWDSKTQKKLDKDRFRRDLGDVENAYQEILKRLND